MAITINDFKLILSQRVLVLDGAMGTMIQDANLSEGDFSDRDVLQSYHPDKPQQGNNDILVLTRPDIIANIHKCYVDADADIISTCTFNANAISQADYGMQSAVRDINLAAARIARDIADSYTHQVFVAGSIGPTNKTASMSPDLSDPGARDVTFDDLFHAYSEQINALVDGGVDILLFETVFDTLNLKAGLAAADAIIAERGIDLPIMVSLTLSSGGRTFSGQTIPAFITSIDHSPNIVSIGFNCSFGPEAMLPYLRELSAITSHAISVHPNAGLPDDNGQYNETPILMSRAISTMLSEQLLNIVGGCCGTAPAHIRQIAGLARQAAPRTAPSMHDAETMRLAGLEQLDVNHTNNFVNIGERCNVAGSRKFLRLIKEHDFDQALQIARRQVEDGAQILDINMDDGLLDVAAEMTHFLNLIAAEPAISRVPLMIDSSDFAVITAALKTIQGKPIVNSISLKEGEDTFIRQARHIASMGAAMVVMAFDEQGQATTYERKIQICSRAYDILVNRLAIAPTDIIFDPNILTIATGIDEHDSFAIDFIRATSWIKQNLPGAKVSGGVSNLSFAFRGNNYLREAMHAVFLYHAIAAGMDMAIVNPATTVTYDAIDPHLRQLLEDVILNRRHGAVAELAEYSRQLADVSAPSTQATQDRSHMSLSERLSHAIVNGDDANLADDLAEAAATYPSAVSIIEGPLLQAMNAVGTMFGEGRMFLPQVVKAARTMKRAVQILTPLFGNTDNASVRKSGVIVIATVKGDVHDIGKNIVSIVLACNNFEVHDLGVMVSADTIVSQARALNADIVCLSGLITPSLGEMAVVARAMQEADMTIPIFVGGATTSPEHTAIKLAPHYSGPVIHIADAAQNPIVASALLNPATRDSYLADLAARQQAIRDSHTSHPTLTPDQARAMRLPFYPDTVAPAPIHPGRTVLSIPVDQIAPYINWQFFDHAWRLDRPCHCDHCRDHRDTERDTLRADADALLAQLAAMPQSPVTAIVVLGPASSSEQIIHFDGIDIPTPRQQYPDRGQCLSLADYIAPQDEPYTDHAGLFAVSVGRGLQPLYQQYQDNADAYAQLLLQSLSDRLAEAAAEWLHHHVRTRLWGYAPDEDLTIKQMWQNRHRGIRPAIGYPSLPDQRLMHLLDQSLHLADIGVTLTDNGAMSPSSTVSGIYIAHPDARYFSVR